MAFINDTELLIIEFIFAPLLYWFSGAAVLSFCTKSKNSSWLFPIVGWVSISWAVQILFFLGSKNSSLTLLILLVLLVLICLLKKETLNLGKSFQVYLLFFGATTLIQALVVYPGVGRWSGDWFFHLTLSDCFFRGELCGEMVQRPPLFASGFFPLRWFNESLVSFQIGNAIVSSAAIMTLFFGLPKLRTNIRYSYLIIILGTPFYLLHSTYPWPKLLTGGCQLIAIILSAAAFKSKNKWIAIQSGIWMGLAANAHHSTLLCLPLFFALWKKSSKKTLTKSATLFVYALTAGILTSFPFELWTVISFGIHEKLTKNAGVIWRYGEPISNFFGALFTTFVSRFPKEVVIFFRELGPPHVFLDYLSRMYFVISAIVTGMAGSLLGLFVPWLFAGDRDYFFERLKVDLRRYPFFLPCFIATVIFHAVAVPYNDYVGVTQVGLVGLSLLALLVALKWLLDSPNEGTKNRISVATLVTGTLPFLLTQVSVLALCLWGRKYNYFEFQNRLLQYDEDGKIFWGNQMSSLGFTLFPFGLIISIVIVAVSLFMLKVIRTDSKTCR